MMWHGSRLVGRWSGGCVRLGLCAVVCLLLGACVLRSRPARLGRNQWRSDRGPVIPHDTFPADCSLCHTGSDWTTLRDDFTFDHAAETGVALEGAHSTAQCLRCHNDRGPVGEFARRGCAGCHQDEHRGQLGTRCEQCHNQRDWIPEGQILMHNRTRFPLVGAHVGAACFRCHPGAQVGNFARAPVRCEACHQSRAFQADNPDHAAQGWTHDCQRCHTPIAWQGAGFRHTRFPLTGAHAAADCSACHHNGIYSGLPHDCAACHLSDYQAAQNPNHVSGGFPTNCEACHNTTSWRGASFNHSGITSNCAQCHLPQYNATTRPNHAAAGYPTTCELCHQTSSWSASFNHRFNINSGPHRRYDCAECHRVPGNYGVVSCTHCHTHRQSKMDAKHRNVSGYSWASPSCIRCHPTGRG